MLPTETPTPTQTDTPTATPEPSFTPWPSWTPWPSDTPTATPGTAPSNDDFNSALLVSYLPYTTSIDTTGATVASDDPNMGSSTGVNSNTVWFRYVAPGPGTVVASSIGSNYDTVLAVFTGSRGALNLIASNDDSGGTNQSQATFAIQTGMTYYVEVAQYGYTGGGQLQFRMDGGSALTVTPTVTPIATAYVTPTDITLTPGVLGVQPAPAPAGIVDARYFSQTGYRVNVDAFWDYFNKRGGIRTFGYPSSNEFSLMGFQVQFFQRAVMQLMPNGNVATMNLLDDGIMPYTKINGSTFPGPEQDLIESAPSPLDPNYGDEAIAFLRANVPDEWDGQPVNFLQTFLATVRYEDAFPEGVGNPALVPLMCLEYWGLPTSRPAYDPANHKFVYQRFQRGVMHYDASTGATQGLLLSDYLKSLMTGQDLPTDLEYQASGSRFYRQYDATKPNHVSRPIQLPGTDLTRAFEPQAIQPRQTAIPTSTPTATPTSTRTPTPTSTVTIGTATTSTATTGTATTSTTTTSAATLGPIVLPWVTDTAH